MSPGIVILAAGESARMGAPKQSLPYRGGTLLLHAVESARLLSGAPITVVLGAHAAPIRAELADCPVAITENSDWRSGLGSSLRAGLQALLAAQPATEAVIFLVCDQPLISARHLNALLTEHERTGRPIVASEYGDTLGVPALFARALFPALLALAGSEGARQVIQDHRDQAIGIPFADGAVDIDTPADYARLVSSRHDVPTLAPV